MTSKKKPKGKLAKDKRKTSKGKGPATTPRTRRSSHEPLPTTARETTPQPVESSQAIAIQDIPFEFPRLREPPRRSTTVDPLTGDLPGVTLRNEAEVIAHFERVDPRLADAWRRDVVVHEGPITLRRIASSVFGGGGSFGGSTHYAYVDRRLLWYLTPDPSDPLGARWDGYLASRYDAPPGTTAVGVGLDIVARKIQPRLEGGDQ